MPRRTNDFQKLVYLLHTQIDAGLTVTESALLESEQAGTTVEVDILIETVVAGTDVRIGVECTASGRKATVEWVRNMYGKHESVPVDATVLVAKNGFTRAAIEQAKAWNLRIMTLEEAESADWSDLIEDISNLSLASFQFRIIGGTVYSDKPKDESRPMTVTQSSPVNRGLPEDPIEFSSLTHAIIADQRVGRTVMQQWVDIPKEQRPLQFEFEINWRPESTCSLTDAEGRVFPVTQIDVKVAARIRDTRLAMSAGRYAGMQIAHGTAENIFDESADKARSVVVALRRSGDGETTGSLMIPKYKGEQDAVFNMEFKKSDGG